MHRLLEKSLLWICLITEMVRIIHHRNRKTRGIVNTNDLYVFPDIYLEQHSISLTFIDIT